MHQLTPPGSPAAPGLPPHAAPVPAAAHTAVLAPSRPTAAAEPDPPIGPSRLVPFLMFGGISTVLLVIAAVLRRDTTPAWADLGDYSCLGGCLSGVAAAIFGCVTLSRALRRRRKR